ncbi:hypothetical protein C2W62_52615, partial [Candidatus Entotheonella serta]
MVIAIARDCYRRLYPPHELQGDTKERPTFLQEWIQVGWTALLEVEGKYNPNHVTGAKFSTYAALRIRGAIFDSIIENATIRRPRQRLSQIARQQ